MYFLKMIHENNTINYDNIVRALVNSDNNRSLNHKIPKEDLMISIETPNGILLENKGQGLVIFIMKKGLIQAKTGKHTNTRRFLILIVFIRSLSIKLNRTKRSTKAKVNFLMILRNSSNQTFSKTSQMMISKTLIVLTLMIQILENLEGKWCETYFLVGDYFLF